MVLFFFVNDSLTTIFLESAFSLRKDEKLKNVKYLQSNRVCSKKIAATQAMWVVCYFRIMSLFVLCLLKQFHMILTSLACWKLIDVLSQKCRKQS